MRRTPPPTHTQANRKKDAMLVGLVCVSGERRDRGRNKRMSDLQSLFKLLVPLFEQPPRPSLGPAEFRQFGVAFFTIFGCAAFNASALPPRRRPQQQRRQRRRQRQHHAGVALYPFRSPRSLQLSRPLSYTLSFSLCLSLRVSPASCSSSVLVRFVPSLRFALTSLSLSLLCLHCKPRNTCQHVSRADILG